MLEKSLNVFSASTMNRSVIQVFFIHNRLVRVRQRQEYDRRTSVLSGSQINTSENVCLFEEYAAVDRKKKFFFLGQVVRMTHKGQEYRRPVQFKDSKGADITVMMVKYQKAGEVTFKPTDDIIKLNFTFD